MSQVMGKGFDVTKIPISEVDTVLIFATGTGISPIRALIEADENFGGILPSKRKQVILFYGVRLRSRFCIPFICVSKT